MENMLKIQGVPVGELARIYGTPLYIYDQDRMEEQMDTYQKSFQSDVLETEVLYASKAFCIQEMLRLVQAHGLSLDVGSGGELYTALAAGFDPARIHFHGNNKSPQEIEEALQAKVGTFIVDNVMEGEYLCAQMERFDHDVHVMIRVNPGVEAHTHEYIVTAHIDSKFGISIHEQDTLEALIRHFEQTEHIVFDGFHAHIGSQIFDAQAFAAEIDVMGRFMAEMQQRGIMARCLDVGGGFAVHYTDADRPIPIPEVCRTIVTECERQKKEHGLALEKIMIEPGRSIVAEAGLTLYTAGFGKHTPNRTYLFVDGGMSDNIRPALYQAAYSCDVANRMDEEKCIPTCVAGKCCESGDVLIEEAMLPPCEPGDLLAVYSTGAYGFSMASHYNRLCRPAVVFVKGGKARCVVKRETYADLLRGECAG